MKDSGYVILHRSMLEWEWYGDEAVKVLFLHLLLKANWKPGKFRGQDVPCGSMICSIEALAANLGWTRSRVRHTLDKLKATGEVTSTTTNHWTTLTIVNWAKYQGGNQRSSQPTAIKAANKQPTNSQPTATIEEGKNSNKGRINRESTPSASRSLTFKTWTVDDFKRECKAIVDADPASLLQSERAAFFAYWTEQSAYGQMRFQGEKFFDLRRRMSTWQQRAAQTAPKRGNGTVIPINAESLPHEERKAIRNRIQGELRAKYGWQPGQPVQREWIDPQFLDIMGFSKSAS